MSAVAARPFAADARARPARDERPFPYDLPARLMREHLVMLRALDRVSLDAALGRTSAAAESVELFQGLLASYRESACDVAFPVLIVNTSGDPNAAVAVRMAQRQFDATTDGIDDLLRRFRGRPVAEWDAGALAHSAGLMRGRMAALARRVELLLLSYFGPPPRHR